jgi:integrase
MINYLNFEVTHTIRKTDGLVSLSLRVENKAYIGGRHKHRSSISLKTYIKQEIFAFTSSRYGPWVKGDGENEMLINQGIRDSMTKIENIYLKLKTKLQREPFASELTDIFVNGEKTRLRKTIFEFLPEYVASEKLSESSANSYNIKFTFALKNFLKVKYDRETIFLDEIDLQFIYRFESFMASSNTKYGKQYKPGTARLYMHLLKAIVRHAFRVGEIDNDVADEHIATTSTNKRKTAHIVENFSEAVTWKISREDLHKIETTPIIGKAVKGENENAVGANQHMYDLVRVRLLFLLQTWTGLAYADLNALRDVKMHVRIDLHGRKCLMYYRQKNGQLASVPIFPETEKLLDELEWNASPMGSYDTYNRKIKALLKYYNIEMREEDKDGSTHLGRHLFGTRMLVSQFSLESISLMMGHSSIRETERVYARVDMTKVQADYDRINARQNVPV